MREVVTLQLGNFSNYVATHFWNTQESYFTYSDDEAETLIDHDIHWRVGVGVDGSDTFLPRTVIYDLKGSFGPLRKINPLYDAGMEGDTADDSLWPGKPIVNKQIPLQLGEYQKSLDSGTTPSKLQASSVRYWSDFSRVYFHPRSLVQLYDFQLHSTIMPFERFDMGAELFRSLDRDEDIVDRDWRPFVEECDQMQSIQIFTTLDDAWAGFASSYVEALRDEHPKSCIWVWGMQTPAAATDLTREKRQLRSANVAQSLHQICSQASMLVPLAVPAGPLPANISVIAAASPWITSALLAAAAESSLLPSRIRAKNTMLSASVSDLAQSLNVAGNQTLANMRMAVGSESGEKNNDDGSLNVNLSDFGSLVHQTTKDDGGRYFGRLSTLRGLNTCDEKETTSEMEGGDARRPVIGSAVFRSYSLPLDFPLLDSYPPIYSEAATDSGIQVHTTVSTDKSIGARMKQLGVQATWALPSDHRETLANGLAELGDAYQHDWSSGSDLDDDDL